MKLLDRLRGRMEQRAADPSWEALTAAGGMNTTAGVHVDARSAESLSAVYACVQAISESVSTLPLHVYRRTETGDRERADGHWLSRVLDQCGMEFRESMTASVLLHGNAYARIERNGAGEVVALHPLHPQRVTIVKLANGNHRYDCTDDNGAMARLLLDEVLHLRDRTEPGSLMGRSRIAIARESLGLSLSLRAHGTAVFGRGERPASVITNESAREYTAEEMLMLRRRLDTYASPVNAGKTMVLLRGMKYHTVGLSNEDAEWLNAMQFGVTEICRIFRVPPILVQELAHATYSNVTELGLQFVRYSLARWISMWEEGITRSLLGPIARKRYYAEHAVDGLLRAQPKERAEFYGNAIRDGWMTAVEVRKLENLPAINAQSLAAD